MEREVRLGKPDRYPCPECRQGFPSVDDLAAHLFTHDANGMPRKDRRGFVIRRWTCRAHDFTATNGNQWAKHKRDFHRGCDPRNSPDAPPPQTPLVASRPPFLDPLARLEADHKTKGLESA